MQKIFSNLKEKSKTIQRDTAALYFAYRDKRTPWYARAFCALVVAYFLSPIDLIPDFIPILGYADDLILIPLGISLAVKMIPAEVMAEARLKACAPIANKAARLILILAILCVWACLLFLFGSAILKLATRTH
jgi:uncharacterized membrane protein YkvA (DUF1232 family)